MSSNTAKASESHFALHLPDGDTLEIPPIGLGTFSPEAGTVETVKQAVLEALKAGYRHIDTAFAYGDGSSERGVGKAVNEWGGPREDLFIVSKLSNAHHQPEDVENALRLSLENLNMEYLDLYLMHFPVAYHREGVEPRSWKTARDASGKTGSVRNWEADKSKAVIDRELTSRIGLTWKAMESLVRKGLVKSIGISNFNILKTNKLLKTAEIRPAVNQVELHPYLPQNELLAFCRKEGIHVTAHSPLGGRPVDVVAPNKHIPGPLNCPVVKSLAEKHSTTPATILLKWAIQRGTSVVPKSFNADRIRKNWDVVARPNLPEADMQALNNLKGSGSHVRFNDPRQYYGLDIYDESKDEPEASGEDAWNL